MGKQIISKSDFTDAAAITTALKAGNTALEKATDLEQEVGYLGESGEGYLKSYKIYEGKYLTKNKTVNVLSSYSILVYKVIKDKTYTINWKAYAAVAAYCYFSENSALTTASMELVLGDGSSSVVSGTFTPTADGYLFLSCSVSYIAQNENAVYGYVDILNPKGTESYKIDSALKDSSISWLSNVALIQKKDIDNGAIEGYYLNAKGTWASLSSNITKYWKVTKGEIVKIHGGTNTSYCGYAFFAEEPTTSVSAYSIGANTSGDKEVVCPIDGYIAVSDYKEQAYMYRMMSESSVKSKKFLSIGDSITYRGIWQRYLAEMMGNTTYTNQGVSGRKVGLYIRDQDGNLITADTLQSYDFIIFGSYANNYGTSTPLGTIDDAVDETGTGSFYSQVKTVCEYLSTNAPDVPIFAFSNLRFRGYFGTEWDAVNSEGLTTTDYHDAMKKVCEKYAIPFIDNFIYGGVNALNASSYYEDDDYIHPSNGKGMQRMADNIFEMLKNKSRLL